MTSFRKQVVAVAVKGEIQPPKGAVCVRSGSDQSVIFYGLPTRKENDIEEALRWVTSQINDHRQAVVREVTVEADGDQLSVPWEETFGPYFANTQPGDVLVSRSVAKIYDRLFLFEAAQDRGHELFFLRGLRKRPQRIRGLRADFSPLIGREKELSRLSELSEQAFLDQGQVVSISGDAGIGKTRVIEAIKDYFLNKSVPVWQGAFLPYSNRPYEAFESILSPLDLSEYTQAQGDFVRALLEPSAKIDRVKELTEEQIQQGLYSSIKKIWFNKGQAPLVIIMDDLHWAQPASIDLLQELVEGLETTRIFLLLSHRPEFAGANPTWRARLNFSEIPLGPLVDGQVTQFIKESLNVDHVSERLTQNLIQSSLGNPLFIEESIRHSMDTGTLSVKTDDSGFSSVQIHGNSKGIPSTLRSLISSRLDQVSATTRDVLSWASLLGSSFRTDELLGLLKAQGLTLLVSPLSELISKNYLQEKSSFPAHFHQFSHDLVYEVVKDSLSIQEQRRRHAQIGQFLEAIYLKPSFEQLERIATHFLEGDLPAQALLYARRAGQSALEHHQYSRAADFLREAERGWETSARKEFSAADIYVPWVKALLASSRSDRARDALAKWSKSLSTDVVENAQFHRLKMAYHTGRQEFEDAMFESDKAADTFMGDPTFLKDREDFIHDRVEILFSLGRSEEALHETRLALRDLEKMGTPLSKLRTTLNAAFYSVTSGNPELSIDAQLLQSQLDWAASFAQADFPDKFQVHFSLQLATIFETLGQYQHAREFADRSVHKAREGSLRQSEVQGLLRKAGIDSEMGLYQSALETYETALTQANEIKNRAFQVQGMEGISQTLLRLGAFEEAEALRIAPHHPYSRRMTFLQKAARLSIGAFLRWEKGEYFEASQSWLESSHEYEKAGHLLARDHCRLRSLRAKSDGNLEPSEILMKEFEQIPYRNESALLGDQWATQFALGGPLSKSSLDVQLIPSAWLRREVMARRFKWLTTIGKDSELEKAREDYQQEIEAQLQNVPVAYRTVFTAHPIGRADQAAKA